MKRHQLLSLVAAASLAMALGGCVSKDVNFETGAIQVTFADPPDGAQSARDQIEGEGVTLAGQILKSSNDNVVQAGPINLNFSWESETDSNARGGGIQASVAPQGQANATNSTDGDQGIKSDPPAEPEDDPDVIEEDNEEPAPGES